MSALNRRLLVVCHVRHQAQNAANADTWEQAKIVLCWSCKVQAHARCVNVFKYLIHGEKLHVEDVQRCCVQAYCADVHNNRRHGRLTAFLARTCLI